MGNNNYYEIDLDIWKQFPVQKISVKQLDIGRKIRINLYSNNYKLDISKSQVTVYIKKDKKNIIFNNCKIIDTNIIELEITSSIVETIGQLNAEIDIMSEGISTFNFIIEVVETNKNTIQITQTSEYNALVNLFKEMNNIDGKIEEVSNEFNNQLEAIASNVTNGNESATNSEIVLARQGNISLGVNINKIKNNVSKTLESVFDKGLRDALSNDFLGNSTVSINSDNLLSVNEISNNYDYIYCDSDVIEFKCNNGNNILLGYEDNWFTTINLMSINGASCGRILKWYANGYSVVADNVFSNEFLPTDIAKVEIINDGYKLYKNNNLIFTIKKSDYSNAAWSISKLGFFVKKDETTDLFKDIKVIDYSESRVLKNTDDIANIKNSINNIDSIVNYTNIETLETETTIDDLISNYEATPTISENVLNCNQPSLTYNYIGIVTNRIKFTLKKANYIVLGKNGTNITGICLKSDNSNYIGLLSDYINQTLKVRATLTFDSCQEGDEIIITLENDKYTFEKNGSLWFIINKNDYQTVECWDEKCLGFMLTTSMYQNICENLYHNIENTVKAPIKDKVTELDNKIKGLNVSKFVGKKIAFLGDSITYGYGLADRTKAWCYILANLLGCTNFVNMGISGSTIANGSGDSALCKRYYMIDKDVDYIFVFAGTNDYGMYPTEIGIETDNDGTTFYGGLNKLIKGLMENYPKARIYFMTPLKRMCSKEFIDENDYHVNTVGYNLNEYRQAIINRCEFYGVKVIDLYTKSGLNPSILSNRAEYFLDVVHTNEKGHEVIALTVQEEL